DRLRVRDFFIIDSPKPPKRGRTIPVRFPPPPPLLPHPRWRGLTTSGPGTTLPPRCRLWHGSCASMRIPPRTLSRPHDKLREDELAKTAYHALVSRALPLIMASREARRSLADILYAQCALLTRARGVPLLGERHPQKAEQTNPAAIELGPCHETKCLGKGETTMM